MGEHGAGDQEQRQPIPDAFGWNVLSTLMSGVLLGVGVGWLLSRWVGTELMYVVGLLAGTALSMYSIWARYLRR